MSVFDYCVAGFFAVLMLIIVFRVDILAICTKLLKNIWLMPVVCYGILGLLIFSIPNIMALTVIGLIIGIAVGLTASMWWGAFQWKGRLIASLSTLAMLVVSIVYWFPGLVAKLFA